MKLLLRLSAAALLISTALAGLSLEEFIANKEVNTLAPHLVQEISSQGIESFATASDLPPITAMLQVPLLDDIVQIVSLNIFNGKGADWSRLEAAKIKIIQEHGAEALAASANLTLVDTHQARTIVNTIYDTVIHLPSASKATYESAKSGTATDVSGGEAKVLKETQGATEGQTEEASADAEKKKSSSVWDILGFGLIKSSDTVRKAKGVVSPTSVCETTDTAYLKGVEDVVYYSSLTHGLAGGALASPESSVQSLDLQTIVSSIGKLAIEIQMAQSIARLGDLNPEEPAVRALTYLALAADSATSQSAQSARDIHNLINKGKAGLIPESVLRSLSDQAALVLITKGAGEVSGPSAFASIPFLRNVFAFSNEVLSANNIGDVLKFVYCPESRDPSTEASSAEQVKEKVDEKAEEAKAKAEDIKDKTEETKEQAADGAQKVLKVAQDTAQKVSEQAKAGAEVVQDQAKAGAEVVQDKAKAAKDAIVEGATDTAADAQAKVQEGTERVNQAGQQAAQDVEDAAKQAKRKAEELAAAAKSKGEAAVADTQEAASNAGDEIKKKAEEVRAQAEEAARKAAEKVQPEEAKQEL